MKKLLISLVYKVYAQHRYSFVHAGPNDPVVSKELIRVRDSVYRKHKFIEGEHSDDFHPHSTYFYVARLRGSSPLVMLRVTRKNGKGVLPMLEHGVVFDRKYSEKIVDDIKNDKVVEIGSFVKNPANKVGGLVPLFLLQFTAEECLRKGVKYWLLAVGESILPRYSSLLGDKLIPIGEKTIYPGEPVYPRAYSLLDEEIF